jgi:hypothetical protein
LAATAHNVGMDFQIQLRGYDQRQVDVLIERAEKASNSTDPVVRAKVREELGSVRLTVVWRGYMRREVDGFFRYMIEELA